MLGSWWQNAVASLLSLLLAWLAGSPTLTARAAEARTSTNTTASLKTNSAATAEISAALRFNVHSYMIEAEGVLSTNRPSLNFAQFTGTNVGLAEIVHAAAELQSEYRNRGYATVSVAIAQRQISNGVVTMHVFQGRIPQILISGKRYYGPNEVPAIALQPATAAPQTNAVPTNAIPHFNVKTYVVEGNSLLSTNTILLLLSKYTGTNVSLPDIVKAASDLRLEYRTRGYPTVDVVIPQQTITNAMVRLQVFQGRLTQIQVVGNRYFSSNNVMRALPSLHTNVILNGTLFQAELDRANANQDRQIFPQIEPGADPNTTELVLQVRDRLPLHGKVDFNNQNTPGTPDLRLNSSAVYNNLWQIEQSLGLQYSFSPETYKSGRHWNFYDLPEVANYSGFYRLPLANPASIEDIVTSNPGSFGYNEAARRFNLPPSSGRPELNIYASGSSIDTGLEPISHRTITNTEALKIVQEDVQQDITINNSLGFRLSAPIVLGKWVTTFSGGLDYKNYDLTTVKTNNFIFTVITRNPDGTTNPPQVSIVPSGVPTTHNVLDYMPLSMRWDGSRPDKSGVTTFSINYSPNFTGRMFANTEANFAKVAGSTNANGYYHIFNVSIARDQKVYKEWLLTVRVDGQWASQPLISNEQFGIGGANSRPRGYLEGEVYGDAGWRIITEQKTPPWIVGTVYGKHPLVVRGSIFMDYAEAYLIDRGKNDSRTPLWGTGVGGVASVGANWEARLLCSWPLLDFGTIVAGQPRFDFSLSAQF
jgi:hemolysin activation/secretion protein